MNTEKKYYSKLMITGEYGVIVGGEALTMPLKQYYARVQHRDQEADMDKVIDSVAALRELFNYLHSLPSKSFYARIDDKHMDDMLKKGFFIQSNIPAGYGIGSSGSVSALVYDQFFKEQQDLSLQQLRKDLSTIESFFHGKSSGVDALTCYTSSPLHFKEDGSIEVSKFSTEDIPGEYAFFLLDTGHFFETAPLVNHFLENMRKKEYKAVIMEEYLPLIKKLIRSLKRELHVDPALLFRAISDFQWQHFRQMIPETLEDLWLDGQVSNNYYLKINGSGGGFALGIAYKEGKASVEQMMEGKELIWI